SWSASRIRADTQVRPDNSSLNLHPGIRPTEIGRGGAALPYFPAFPGYGFFYSISFPRPGFLPT
ncbi:MAG: hypothetical protein Q7V36_05010, partial [Deltaproteobacteria bacterium]|nr:hypothetical protein [Deltaproteobacteria bacterium]